MLAGISHKRKAREEQDLIASDAVPRHIKALDVDRSQTKPASTPPQSSGSQDEGRLSGKSKKRKSRLSAMATKVASRKATKAASLPPAAQPALLVAASAAALPVAPRSGSQPPAAAPVPAHEALVARLLEAHGAARLSAAGSHPAVYALSRPAP
jgi:hypothetical protein